MPRKATLSGQPGPGWRVRLGYGPRIIVLHCHSDSESGWTDSEAQTQAQADRRSTVGRRRISRPLFSAGSYGPGFQVSADSYGRRGRDPGLAGSASDMANVPPSQTVGDSDELNVC